MPSTCLSTLLWKVKAVNVFANSSCFLASSFDSSARYPASECLSLSSSSASTRGAHPSGRGQSPAKTFARLYCAWGRPCWLAWRKRSAACLALRLVRCVKSRSANSLSLRCCSSSALYDTSSACIRFSSPSSRPSSIAWNLACFAATFFSASFVLSTLTCFLTTACFALSCPCLYFSASACISLASSIFILVDSSSASFLYSSYSRSASAPLHT
mmetsp:Transcript_25346/g.61032  ORF Transcript_25346/g.61032 Transcript_25346/m.61032 type:complete len:214 (-) Transcript_25346:1469-2110(-)